MVKVRLTDGEQDAHQEARGGFAPREYAKVGDGHEDVVASVSRRGGLDEFSWALDILLNNERARLLRVALGAEAAFMRDKLVDEMLTCYRWRFLLRWTFWFEKNTSL